jgi:hypothetical protein
MGTAGSMPGARKLTVAAAGREESSLGCWRLAVALLVFLAESPAVRRDHARQSPVPAVGLPSPCIPISSKF